MQNSRKIGLKIIFVTCVKLIGLLGMRNIIFATTILKPKTPMQT